MATTFNAKIMGVIKSSETLDDFIRGYGKTEYESLSDDDKREIDKHFKGRSSSASAKDSPIDGLKSFLEKVAATQQVQTYGYDSNEVVLLTDIANEKSFIQKIEGQIITQLQQEAQLHNKINEEVGMLGELSNDFRSEIIDAYPDVLRLGYGMGQLGDFIKSMIEQSGRFNIVSSETIKEVAGTSRAFVGDIKLMGDYLNRFMNIGLGARDASREINEAGFEALRLGLNSKKTTEMLMANLGKINEYGFKNGTEGLSRMVQKSIEFRMNIEETFKIAEKVWSPEGAIDLAANLQVIGGSIGAFNDPLKLMYMATNDVEGLQEALIGAASGLATYNEEQGRFEVTGVNLRRAKAMADSLGVSMSELTKGAIASAERLQVNSQLMAKGFDINEKDREFLTNMSKMEGGKMVIDLPKDIAKKLNIEGTMIDLGEANQDQINVLLNYRADLEKNFKTTEQIARDQVNLVTNIERDLSFIAAQARSGASKIIRTQMRNMGYDQTDAQEVITYYTDLVSKGLIEPTTEEVLKLIGDVRDKNSDVHKALILKTKDTSEVTTKLKQEVVQNPSLPTSTTETNSNINVKISADGYFDIFASELRRQPQIWKEHIETNKSSYTVPGNQ